MSTFTNTNYNASTNTLKTKIYEHFEDLRGCKKAIPRSLQPLKWSGLMATNHPTVTCRSGDFNKKYMCNLTTNTKSET